MDSLCGGPPISSQSQRGQNAFYRSQLFSHWLRVAWKTKGAVLDCDDTPVRPRLNRQVHQLGTKFGGRDEKVSPSPPYGPGANGWENGTIGTFLERDASRSESTAAGTQYYSLPENPWKRCAHTLLWREVP